MNNEFKVKLITVGDVILMVETASSCPKGIDIEAVHGRHVVDAKSLMGVMSLNLSVPITIRICGTSNDEETKCIAEKFAQWRAD